MASTVSTIVAHAEPFPGFCYMSGLTIFDEALIKGRWIGRYWTASGFVVPERDLTWLTDNVVKPVKTAGLDLHAFWLEVDGQALHFGWELAGQQVEPGAKGGSHGWVELRSTVRPVSVRVHTESDGTGFFTRWLEITNTGERPAALNSVCPFAGLLNVLSAGVSSHYYPPSLGTPAGAEKPTYSLGYYAESDWGNEGAFTWLPLPSTPVRIEGRLGKSGHGQPFFILRNEHYGEHLVGGLEWSSNWQAEFTALHRPFERGATLVSCRLGPAGPGPLRVIAPGETVSTPRAHVGLLFADLDGCVNVWHAHLRASVLPKPAPERELLVNLDHWSYLEHELSEETLRHEIDVAAEIGAEVFTVDAGWYGDRATSWWRTVGNWERAGDRLPNDLHPVFDYARQKGLKCGLWLDIERIGAESRAALAHPDWFVPYYGQPSDEFDLTIPAAQAWMEGWLVNVIERYRLDLFRLDYNTSPYEGGQNPRDGFQENTRWRYYEFIYDLYRRIQRRFPNLIMENCAGGGGRTDLGMMSIFHYVQVTDWPILPRAVRILNGMTLALPPERLLFWTGVGQAGHVRGDLDAQMRLAVLTHFGVCGVIPAGNQRNDETMARVKHHVDLYKRAVRPIIADCRIYHHTPILPGLEPQGWCVLEYASADSTRGVIGLFRLGGEAEPVCRVQPRGLDLGRTYRVTWDNTGQVSQVDGFVLMQQGIIVRLEGALTSELLVFEAL
ncbi:MAG: alpha-galactosidase [Anaerolineae bacterium]|nr:alpha-galactosidase [Anaerolineae bacterium]